MVSRAQRKYLRAYNHGFDAGRRRGAFLSFIAGVLITLAIVGYTLAWLQPGTLTLSPGETITFHVPGLQGTETLAPWPDSEGNIVPLHEPVFKEMKYLRQEGWL